MKHFSPDTGFYELSLPDNWTYSEENNTVSFFEKTNGVGAIHISCFSIDSSVEINLPSELAEFLLDVTSLTKNELLSKIAIFNNRAFVNLVKNDRYWEYYMIYKPGKILFITYNCNQLDHQIEKPIIENIIRSVVF